MDATAPPARDGNQTLARGLQVLLSIAESRDGLTVQQVADLIEVHRSIAYRLLRTLDDFGLVARSSDGSYLPGARLATLADSYMPRLRDAAEPVMRRLADRLQLTALLFVEQRSSAISILMIEPTTAVHHIAFRAGMKTPLDRGAAAYAIRASGPAEPDEPEGVINARERGYAQSDAEIEDGTHGIAAWLPGSDLPARAALLLASYQPIPATASAELIRSAKEIGKSLSR